MEKPKVKINYSLEGDLLYPETRDDLNRMNYPNYSLNVSEDANSECEYLLKKTVNDKRIMGLLKVFNEELRISCIGVRAGIRTIGVDKNGYNDNELKKFVNSDYKFSLEGYVSSLNIEINEIILRQEEKIIEYKREIEPINKKRNELKKLEKILNR